VKFDPNATPPEYTDGDDTHIKVGTHVRIKVMGTRAEVGELWAIGSIKEDYLGYVTLSAMNFDVSQPVNARF
jgi:DNA-directed RNA polymerase II subunit RPB7